MEDNLWIILLGPGGLAALIIAGIKGWSEIRKGREQVQEKQEEISDALGKLDMDRKRIAIEASSASMQGMVQLTSELRADLDRLRNEVRDLEGEMTSQEETLNTAVEHIAIRERWMLEHLPGPRPPGLPVIPAALYALLPKPRDRLRSENPSEDDSMKETPPPTCT